jgi:hypothetical protein
MAVRVQVLFEGDTMGEVVSEVRRWLDSSASPGIGPSTPDDARREAEVHELLGAMRGVDSRRFVLELAEAAVRGEGLPFNADVKARYGKSAGTGFGGIVGGPNKLMRRIAKRDLITRDTRVNGYAMDRRDALIVLAQSSPGGPVTPVGEGHSTSGEGGSQKSQARVPWG